jgi:hypothetical protein
MRAGEPAADPDIATLQQREREQARVARPDVPTRMLNGGISSSAIFIAGQLKPQHRLTATSMSRAVASAVSCGDGLGILAGQRAGAEGGMPV